MTEPVLGAAAIVAVSVTFWPSYSLAFAVPAASTATSLTASEMEVVLASQMAYRVVSEVSWEIAPGVPSMAALAYFTAPVGVVAQPWKV